MPTPKSVADKLRDGDYKNQLPYSQEGQTKEQRIAMREAWRAEEARIKERFRADLAAEHDVAGHPKEPKLFELAWEHGHASGLHEVDIYYCDFVELLK